MLPTASNDRIRESQPSSAVISPVTAHVKKAFRQCVGRFKFFNISGLEDGAQRKSQLTQERHSPYNSGSITSRESRWSPGICQGRQYATDQKTARGHFLWRCGATA